jgi:hypothetical protein
MKGLNAITTHNIPILASAVNASAMRGITSNNQTIHFIKKRITSASTDFPLVVILMLVKLSNAP